MTAFPLYKRVEDTLRAWANNLMRLDIPNNIRSSEWEGSIGAGEEKAITHTIGTTPSRFVVLDSADGGILVRGATKWDATHIHVKNRASTTTFQGKVLVLP